MAFQKIIFSRLYRIILCSHGIVLGTNISLFLPFQIEAGEAPLQLPPDVDRLARARRRQRQHGLARRVLRLRVR